MTEQAQELTRDELYALVWETPMSRLAERFGISGNGLAKICRRLEVPYPPRGWWMKKAAGKKVKVDPLPPAQVGTPESVSITATPGASEGLRGKIREKQAEIGPVPVPERLTRPHPLVAAWREERKERLDEQRRERHSWARSPYALTDWTETDRRRHRILQALFQALEKNGAEIGEDDRHHLFATVSGEKITFSIHEKSRQVKRPMTVEEKRWESWNTSGVKTDLEPTGYFQFSIKVWLDQPVRKNWTESERRPIERMLAEIAATFLVLGPLLAERTRVRQEQARRIAEEQRQLELQRQRRQQDENRWARFIEIAEGWKKADLAQEFIARLRETDFSDDAEIDGMTMSEWLDWAEARARDFDPLQQGLERIFGDISQVNSWNYGR